MSTTGRPTVTEVARFFSQARRIPMLVGKLPDGTKIWGGPYTIYQVAALLIVGAGLYLFHDLWGTGAVFADLFMGAVIAVAAAVLAGQIPLDARNPVITVGGFGNALQAPRTGKYRGQAPRLRRPHRSKSMVSVHILAPETVDAVPGDRPELDAEEGMGEESVSVPPEREGSPLPETAPAPSLPRTGLDRLIAQAKKAS